MHTIVQVKKFKKYKAAQNNYILYRAGLWGPRICTSWILLPVHGGQSIDGFDLILLKANFKNVFQVNSEFAKVWQTMF